MRTIVTHTLMVCVLLLVRFCNCERLSHLLNKLLTYLYADDSQLYLLAKADKIALTLPRVASCIDAIDRWMSSK